jgi:hypothetical protein
VKLERLDKLMIDAEGHGYYQADDADPTDTVTPYAKARAREDALLEALKYCLNSLDAYGFGGTLLDTQRAIVRQIEESR